MKLGREADQAYARDYAAKARYDSAARAIGDVLRDPNCCRRLTGEETATLYGAKNRLEERSAHIVSVWD